jgi:hypothetical protein
VSSPIRETGWGFFFGSLATYGVVGGWVDAEDIDDAKELNSSVPHSRHVLA